ncbi:MAG: cupredoxin domain-containing protein [Nitrosotalea sp.]
MKTIPLAIIIGSIGVTVAILAIVTFDQSTSPAPLDTSQTSNMTQSISTVVIPKDSEDQSSGKNYEPQYLVVVLGVNNTVRWENHSNSTQWIVADNSSDSNFAAVTPYSENYMPPSDIKLLSDLYAGSVYVKQILEPDGKKTTLYTATIKSQNYLMPGKSFEYTFTTPGTFGYHGRPLERGSVTVLPPVCSQPTQAIDPGGIGIRSCPIPIIRMESTVFFSSGFDGLYHNKSYSFPVDNYVLQPGHNGTITYLINATSRTNANFDLPPTVNLTNYAHITYQVKYGEGSYGYSSPDGIHVTFDPSSETLGLGDVRVVTATIFVDRDAPAGTYWVFLAPGFCNGGPIFLLTVGDCPYSGVHK